MHRLGKQSEKISMVVLPGLAGVLSDQFYHGLLEGRVLVHLLHDVVVVLVVEQQLADAVGICGFQLQVLDLSIPQPEYGGGRRWLDLIELGVGG